MTVGERANISIPFARQRPSKSFDSCASFMTAIFAVNFDWSIESCDKAPRDLNYEQNTEKYGRAMKLAIESFSLTNVNCIAVDNYIMMLY